MHGCCGAVLVALPQPGSMMCSKQGPPALLGSSRPTGGAGFSTAPSHWQRSALADLLARSCAAVMTNIIPPHTAHGHAFNQSAVPWTCILLPTMCVVYSTYNTIPLQNMMCANCHILPPCLFQHSVFKISKLDAKRPSKLDSAHFTSQLVLQQLHKVAEQLLQSIEILYLELRSSNRRQHTPHMSVMCVLRSLAAAAFGTSSQQCRNMPLQTAGVTSRPPGRQPGLGCACR